ncbi:MAG TPA: hypothetical protein ENL23_03930 [Candidatus Acetothermia bacterium]|nr:hypothetical protein [Candidatus Acetothermia bacterium]
MKAKNMFLVVLGLVAVFSAAGLGVPCDVKAYFVSPSIDNVIEPQIIQALSDAQSEILIAMYSFTDDEIGNAVVAAFQRGVDVRVLLDDGQDSSAQGREWPRLVDARTPIAVEHESGLLHDKFAVIDCVVVITGSYNWTDSADQRNFENIVVITCPDLASKYREEFFRMAREIGTEWEINKKSGESDIRCSCLNRLNSASYDDFHSVDGIGDVLAQRLVDAQPYASVEALDDVQGIGPAKMKAIIDQLCSE